MRLILIDLIAGKGSLHDSKMGVRVGEHITTAGVNLCELASQSSVKRKLASSYEASDEDVPLEPMETYRGVRSNSEPRPKMKDSPGRPLTYEVSDDVQLEPMETYRSVRSNHEPRAEMKDVTAASDLKRLQGVEASEDDTIDSLGDDCSSLSLTACERVIRAPFDHPLPKHASLHKFVGHSMLQLGDRIILVAGGRDRCVRVRACACVSACGFVWVRLHNCAYVC